MNSNNNYYIITTTVCICQCICYSGLSRMNKLLQWLTFNQTYYFQPLSVLHNLMDHWHVHYCTLRIYYSSIRWPRSEHDLFYHWIILNQNIIFVILTFSVGLELWHSETRLIKRAQQSFWWYWWLRGENYFSLYSIKQKYNFL